ncbi:hypothetical protein BH10CYA1_BH10CYA1_47470 [soil metagenome]
MIALTATLALASLLPAAQASNTLITPFVCDTDTVDPVDVTATWVSLPGRGLALRLFLNDTEPLFDDIPGGFLTFQKGPFSSISFAADGIINSAKVGPHVTGFYHLAGGGQVFFDKPSGDGTVSGADSQGFRTVSFTSAQLGIPAGATIDVMTINIGGRSKNKSLPVIENIDHIFFNNKLVSPSLTPTQFTCPFPSN